MPDKDYLQGTRVYLSGPMDFVASRARDAWRALLVRYPDRFVLGSDTWIDERWSRYGEIVALYRGWLAQLPPDVAAAIAYGNGERLFAPR